MLMKPLKITGIMWWILYVEYIDGLVQEKRNSIANALELRLSCTNPSLLETHANLKKNISDNIIFSDIPCRPTNMTRSVPA